MQAGQRIRDYILDQKIGQGGMGEVWSATHTVLQRPVAIKGMALHLATDPEIRERFLLEARAQARLQHPRVLGVIDAFQDGGVDYLVMPLVNGRSLAERITEAHGPLPPAEALHIGADVLDGLEAAHRRGIIHRDVKPSNILLDKEGRAYLTDFGIALLVGQDRMTRTGISLGTPYYMSPEQIRDPKTIDQRSDVYSAACVIYEMLAGRPPFVGNERPGNTDFVLLESHLQLEPQPVRTWNPTIPPAVDAAVLRGLAKEPVKRYGGCEEFRRALSAAAAGANATVAVPEPRPIPSPPPPPPAHQPVTPPMPQVPQRAQSPQMPQIPPPVPLSLPAAGPPAVPPPIPQAGPGPQPIPPAHPYPVPAPAPRSSRAGFLIGIGCGTLVVVAVLALLGQKVLGGMIRGLQGDEPAPVASTTEPGTTPEDPGTAPVDHGTAPVDPGTAPAEGTASGKFVKVWVEHNIQRDGLTGMLIHAHFIIQGAQQDNCQLSAYFHYANGDVLKDFDKDYKTADGQVSVWEDFTPQFESTEFEDFTMFMPYDELHMEAGEHELKFDLQIHHRPSGKIAAESSYVDFKLTQD